MVSATPHPVPQVRLQDHHLHQRWYRPLLTHLGRLLQVEYAVEAIQQTGSTVGLQTTEGVVIVAEKNELSKMLEKGKSSG